MQNQQQQGDEFQPSDQHGASDVALQPTGAPAPATPDAKTERKIMGLTASIARLDDIRDSAGNITRKGAITLDTEKLATLTPDSPEARKLGGQITKKKQDLTSARRQLEDLKNPQQARERKITELNDKKAVLEQTIQFKKDKGVPYSTEHRELQTIKKQITRLNRLDARGEISANHNKLESKPAAEPKKPKRTKHERLQEQLSTLKKSKGDLERQAADAQTDQLRIYLNNRAADIDTEIQAVQTKIEKEAARQLAREQAPPRATRKQDKPPRPDQPSQEERKAAAAARTAAREIRKAAAAAAAARQAAEEAAAEAQKVAEQARITDATAKEAEAQQHANAKIKALQEASEALTELKKDYNAALKRPGSDVLGAFKRMQTQQTLVSTLEQEAEQLGLEVPQEKSETHAERVLNSKPPKAPKPPKEASNETAPQSKPLTPKKHEALLAKIISEQRAAREAAANTDAVEEDGAAKLKRWIAAANARAAQTSGGRGRK